MAIWTQKAEDNKPGRETYHDCPHWRLADRYRHGVGAVFHGEARRRDRRDLKAEDQAGRGMLFSLIGVYMTFVDRQQRECRKPGFQTTLSNRF